MISEYLSLSKHFSRKCSHCYSIWGGGGGVDKPSAQILIHVPQQNHQGILYETCSVNFLIKEIMWVTNEIVSFIDY
jgi:hypothetical protein